MRFLQITSGGGPATGTPDVEHMAKARALITEKIEKGVTLATGGLGRRATAAARVVRKDGQITVEDPPSGDGWMAGGGYALTSHESKEAAIEDAKRTLALMGDATMELIQVSEMYPPPDHQLMDRPQHLPAGVVPYLSFDGASEASAFYQKAFGATEVARMPGQDGKRLMHCHLVINGGAFMIADNFPEMGMGAVQRSASYTMQLVVEDGDAWWSRAIAAGCTEKLPFAVAPWGDKYGQLTDPFGVVWAINSPARK